MGRLAMFLSFVVVMENISYFIILSISLTNHHYFQTYSTALTEYPYFHLRHPLEIVKTVKSKSLAISRHFPAQPICPDLVLAFVPGLNSWESFVANSSIKLFDMR
jgi:hypothetical protein